MIPEDVQLFHLLYRSSTEGRRDLAKQLLTPDDTIKISDTYTSRVAEIFAVIMKSLGLRIDFVDEDETVSEYDNSSLQLFEYEGHEYLCTEYEFMLVRRKKEIEKEILNKYGVIDAVELERLVMEELKNRKYIIGPSDDEIDTVLAYEKDTVIME